MREPIIQGKRLLNDDPRKLVAQAKALGDLSEQD